MVIKNKTSKEIKLLKDINKKLDVLLTDKRYKREKMRRYMKEYRDIII